MGIRVSRGLVQRLPEERTPALRLDAGSLRLRWSEELEQIPDGVVLVVSVAQRKVAVVCALVGRRVVVDDGFSYRARVRGRKTRPPANRIA